MSDLIDQADSGKHLQFQFLRNWSEYTNTKKLRRTYKLLVGGIDQSARRLFKKYCKSVAAGNSDVLNLIAYMKLLKLRDFYEEELSIISDMAEEYEFYLLDGNLLISIIFDYQRPLDKMWDHRGR